MRLVNFLGLTLCTSTIVFLAPIFVRAIAYSTLPTISVIALTVMLISFIALITITLIKTIDW